MTRWQWVLIGISAVLLVVLVTVQGIYRGTHKNDFEQMLRRGRIVAACDDGPWGFVSSGADGERGLGYELIRGIADSLGMELEINICGTADDMLAELDKGYLDLVVMPLAATESLKRKYLVSKPIVRTPLVVVYNKSHGEAVNLENLRNHYLAVQANEAVEMRLKHLEGELGYQIRYQRIDDMPFNSIMDLIVKSAVECTVCPQALAELYCSEHEDLGMSAPISVEQEYVWVMKRNRKETAARLEIKN